MNQNFINTLRDYSRDEQSAKSLGAGMLQCNAMLVPEIAPEIALLISNFPRPIVTNNDPAEFNLAGGAQTHVAGAPKTRYQGSFQMIETDTGQGAAFAELLVACGGTTNCIVYDGRPDRFLRANELRNCAITIESPEGDAEGVSTIMRLSGQMTYNFYGSTANLGSVGSGIGQITTGSGNNSLLDKAQNILNIVYAGNNVVNAIRDIFK